MKATRNSLLSKLSWVFLKDRWFFIISNTLKGFLSKPLELSVLVDFIQLYVSEAGDKIVDIYDQVLDQKRIPMKKTTFEGNMEG